MKELDVLLLRFLEREYPQASPADRQAFARIIELQDPELFGYLVGRTVVADPSLRHVIARIRHEP
ncbi:MAG TPA: succinate dehydrogenase assembly factor 2 [Burkholderiaceae bacterium]|jgi:antitoxin CptB|nr:antitoxin CptB [Pseudomonadota bacterium]HEX5640632.1 succinate dehydrogenase assembly factor 2 [Burkholderiaceae bacterium]